MLAATQIAQTSDPQGSRLLNNTQGDPGWYQARRMYAYSVGESSALTRRISADAYLFLYKELVRLCKDRAFCWPGLDWLAQRLGTGIVKFLARQR